MNRNELKFLLDSVSASVVLALSFTGFLLFFVLPPGTGGRHGGRALSLWGWTRHDFGDIHFYLALTFVALAVVHIWINWMWVCTTFARLCGGEKPEKGRRRAYGIGVAGVVAVVLAAALLWARSQVQMVAGEGRAYGASLEVVKREISGCASPRPAIVERAVVAKNVQADRNFVGRHSQTTTQ